MLPLYRYTILIIFLPLIGLSQHRSNPIDSLIALYDDLGPGDEKINIGQKISEELLFIDRIKAKKYNIETFPQARVSRDPLLKANGYYLNHIFTKKETNSGNYNEFAFLDSSLNILKENYEEIDTDEARLLEYLIHNSRGGNYYNKGEMEKAIEFYQKAFTIAKEINEPKNIAQVNYNIAICHYIIDNYDEAITQLKATYQYASQNKISAIESAALNILGASYQQIDSFAQAKIYVKKAVGLAQKSGNEQQIRETLLNMGLVVEDLAELDSAVYYMEMALDHTIGKEDPLIEAQIYLNMARVESKRDNSDQARKYFVKAENLNNKINRRELDAKLSIDIAGLEYDSKNYKLAYDLLYKGFTAQDSFTAIENRKFIKELELKYGKSEDEKLIANQKLALANNQKKITYLTGGFVFSLLGFLTFYAFYQNSKRNKELVQKKLELKTIEIEAMEKEKNILALSSTLEGQEAERFRIAQDLHDGLGGLLSSVKAHYGKIQKEIKKLESLQVFDTAEGMLDNACEEVRRISHNLMPPLLRSQGLVDAFKGLFNSYRSKNLMIEFDERNMETRLSETQEVFLYRIAQELLSNIRKHSSATKVEVSLYGLDDQIQLIIEDNGLGFTKENELGGLGLISISSRVEYLNGELEIESEPGQGCSISIAIPKKI